MNVVNGGQDYRCNEATDPLQCDHEPGIRVVS
jgi:hypothetical protein